MSRMICISDWGPQTPWDNPVDNSATCDWCKDHFFLPVEDNDLALDKAIYVITDEPYTLGQSEFYFCCNRCKDDFKELCVEVDGYEIAEESDD